MTPKKIIITDKLLINKVLYWLNYQPSKYNPSIKTIFRSGAVHSLELSQPKEQLEFFDEFKNTLLYYYKNNDLNSLPEKPTEIGTFTENAFGYDTSSNRLYSIVSVSGPQKPINNNIFDTSLISENFKPSIPTRLATDTCNDVSCEECSSGCYGVCCRPKYTIDGVIQIQGLVTDANLDITDCDKVVMHKFDNANKLQDESDIIQTLEDNGWYISNIDDYVPLNAPCDYEPIITITATCYGQLISDETIPDIESSDYATVYYPDGSFKRCECSSCISQERVFDINMTTQKDCEEKMCGVWLPYCTSERCTIEAITDVRLENEGVLIDISKIKLSALSEFDIVPKTDEFEDTTHIVLTNVDIDTYPNKIGFNVGVANFIPSNSGTIIIPITGCNSEYTSDYVQFSPEPSEIKIITNVKLNTTDNPGIIFDAISTSAEIITTETKSIPLTQCNT